MSAKKRRSRNGKALGVCVIVLAFIAVMAVQIYRIKQKDDNYAAKEQELMQQYEDIEAWDKPNKKLIMDEIKKGNCQDTKRT